MKNKSIKLMSTLVVGSMLLVGCSKPAEQPIDTTVPETTTTTSTTEEVETVKVKDQPMKYIEDKELKDSIEADKDEYIILDVRKAEDYNKAHIDGSFSADQDAANKGGDDESGKANLRTALKEATGSETGNPDDKYALVCYSGKSYAQKATDLMLELGVPADNIYTLDGGMKAWEAGGDEYKNLLK